MRTYCANSHKLLEVVIESLNLMLKDGKNASHHRFNSTC